MKLILTLIACLVLGTVSGCTSRLNSSDPNSIISQYDNRTKLYRQASAALTSYKNAPTGDGPERDLVLAKIEELRVLTLRFSEPRFYRFSQDMRAKHTSTSFDFAEAAIEKGQLDDADQVYRGLIAFYSGASYSGIRDRARLGIDDVRAAR